MIVYAKVSQTNRKIRTVFWELSHIENGCGDTIASCVIGLFDSSGVPISKLACWASDGCNAMLEAARKVQERSELSFLVNLNLVRLDFDYPTEVTKAKFKNLCGRIAGDHCGGMFQNNMEERAQAFASDRARLRKEYLELKKDGATNIESLNLGGKSQPW